MKQYIALFIILLSFQSKVSAQRVASDTVLATPWISVNYGGNWTSGDLSKRYGFLNNLGLFAGYKTNKNWIYGIEGNFIFGQKIKLSGLFDELVDEKGNVTDVNGDIAIIRVQSRGFSVTGSVGKIFSVLSPNSNSGIYTSIGAGYIAHKMRIETQDQVIPSIELDYKKGYDRLTAGLNLTQFIGYALMANRGAFNFYGGFYIQEGLTYNKRTIFFDQPDTPVSTDMRLDIQYGFKIAWLIPIYKRMPKDYYYN